jgi:hypothetical protein
MAISTTALKMRHAWKVRQEKVGTTSFTSDKALSHFVNAIHSKHQCHLIRPSAKQKNADIYPSCNNIEKVKQHCYPTEESFTVTDTLAEVKLQDILDHTILRIVQAHEIILARNVGENIQKTVLVSKWGFGGNTGHSEYKQRFSGKHSDSTCF